MRTHQIGSTRIDPVFRFLHKKLAAWLLDQRKPYLKEYTDILINQYEQDHVFPVFSDNSWDMIRKTELENLVRRLAALYSQESIGADVINAELSEASPRDAAAAPAERESLSDAVDRHIREYFAAHQDRLPPAGLYDRILHEIERPLLALTLAATRGNQVKAAELLGLNRNTLRKKIRELDIQVVRGIR